MLAVLAVPALAAGVLAMAATTSASVGADEVVGHPGLFPVPAGYADAVGVGVDSVAAGLPVCPSAHLCVAAGDARRSATEVDPFVWTSAEAVKGGWTYHLLPVGDAVSAHVASVRCASATSCVASGSVSAPAADGVELQTRTVTWTSTNPSVGTSWRLADAAALVATGLNAASAIEANTERGPVAPPLPEGATGATVSDAVCADTACFAVGHYKDAGGEPRTALWTSTGGSTWTFAPLPLPEGYDYARTEHGTSSLPLQCFGAGAGLACLISGRVLKASGEGRYGLWSSRTPAVAASWKSVTLEQPTAGAVIGAGALAGRATCQSGYCFYANTGPGTANPYGDTYTWATSTPTDGSAWTLIRTPVRSSSAPTVPTSPPKTAPAPATRKTTILPPRPAAKVKVKQLKRGKAKVSWRRPAVSAIQPRTAFRVYLNKKLIKTLTGASLTLTKQRKGRKYTVKIVAYNAAGPSAARKLAYRRTVK